MLRHVVGIVTGGASGLGAATAHEILRHGGKVIVADLPNQQNVFEHKFSKEHQEKQIEFTCTDVTIEEDVTKALDTAEHRFGKPVNVVVNCAGVAPARKTISVRKDDDNNNKNVRIHSLEEFETTLRVNTLGTFNMCRLAAQRMILLGEKDKFVCESEYDDERTTTRSRGLIINTASIAGYEGQMGQVAYASSKAAIIGMTLPFARDLAPHNIRVMTIAPGLFLTPLLEKLPPAVQTELGQTVPHPSRLGRPQEFAQLVSSIILNPMLNGETIRLDGALRMPP